MADHGSSGESSGSGGGSGKSGGGKRRGGRGPGKGGGAGAGGGSGKSGGAGKGHGGRPSGGGRGPAGKPGMRPPILEVAAKSSRTALSRHAESVRGHDVRLACRSLLVAFHGAASGSSNPGELLNLLEQVATAVERGAGSESQLPVALRAVMGYVAERPQRTHAVQEMLRLSLRWGYVQAADYVPRQLRDDGGFRASSILDVFSEIAREYLDDAAFAEGRG